MTILAIDIGGSKTSMVLFEKGKVLDRQEIPTDIKSGPNDWFFQIESLTKQWQGKFNRAGVAVSGWVDKGYWRSLNDLTLNTFGKFNLLERCRESFRVPVTICNDAQAAAWGEHVYGAGKQQDLVYLTISTGIGGGIVLNNKLLLGKSNLAGHFGQLISLFNDNNQKFEDIASGRWIGLEGDSLGLGSSAKTIFSQAAAGDEKAERIIQSSAIRVAKLIQNLQLIFDPKILIIGGGVGLAPGYIERMDSYLNNIEPFIQPNLAKASLGQDAVVFGVANLSEKINDGEEKQ
ncbi:MAG: transcriptional regulator [Euryarchaeota archaeon]|nr:transcriptional regulator [Euryarchaeota archaeon]